LKSLPLAEVEHAMTVACKRCDPRNVFKYFCGVCWNKIKQAEPSPKRDVIDVRSRPDAAVLQERTFTDLLLDPNRRGALREARLQSREARLRRKQRLSEERWPYR
jgi:hypothetical protein